MNYERILRRIRSKIFDYPPHIEEKADRILHKVKQKAILQIETKRRPKTVGPYSGLTKSELRKTGTCEPDWF